jgi:hypothetical protein
VANNITVKDSANADTVLKTTDTAGVHTPHHNIDSSVLPTGAATAAKQDTLQTAVDAIKTAVELLDNFISGSEGQVDVVTSALPTGAATAAKQDTEITHLATLAGAVSGTEMQADIVAALPAGTNNIGDVDVASLPAEVHSADFDTGAGTDTTHAMGIAVPAAGGAAVVPGDATAGLKVNLGADNDVTVTGTVDLGATDNAVLDAIQAAVELIDNAISGNEIQADVLTLPNVTLAAGTNTNEVVGDVAHDAVLAGNPVQIGGGALAFGANPTAVAAGDLARLTLTRAGQLWVLGGHPNTVTLEAAYTAAQTDTAIITVSAGTIIVVTAIEVTLDHATSVDVAFRIGFAAANTPTTTGVLASHAGLAAGSGLVKGNGAGVLGIGADGEDLRITCEVPTGGALRVVVTYFTTEAG